MLSVLKRGQTALSTDVWVRTVEGVVDLGDRVVSPLFVGCGGRQKSASDGMLSVLKRGQTALSTDVWVRTVEGVVDLGTEWSVPFSSGRPPRKIVILFRRKESAMLHWLGNLWRRLDRWVHGVETTPSYRRSNLHGRHR